MAKIIIEIWDEINPLVAMERVLRTMQDGKISCKTIKGVDVPHYCWATRWADGMMVCTRHKRTADGPDSFCVYNRPNASTATSADAPGTGNTDPKAQEEAKTGEAKENGSPTEEGK
jgi:hypothetical protein